MSNNITGDLDLGDLFKDVEDSKKNNSNEFMESTDDRLKRRVDNHDKKFWEHSKEIKKVNKNLTFLHWLIITIIIVLVIAIIWWMYEWYYRLNIIHTEFIEATANLERKIQIIQGMITRFMENLSKS